MLSSFKLPFSFDPKPLQTDLEQIATEDWAAHFNKGYFEGDWTGVALRSVGGRSPRQLYPEPRADGSFVDTPVLERCPNIRELLASFQCPLRSVRFLKLAAGSTIKEHRDYDLGFEEGRIRLHIPIVTNEDVAFFLDAHRIEIRAGECWYLDLSLPHWVENRGTAERIHLVIDCEVNDWMSKLLEPVQASAFHPVGPSAEQAHCSSPADLERFRQAVLDDPKLQHRLRATRDRESFIRLTVAVGHEGGYRFTEADVEEAMRVGRRAWFERWLD
jgi:Aspartyl/Asparaginyl beta-hydroxylase/Nif11 domain